MPVRSQVRTVALLSLALVSCSRPQAGGAALGSTAPGSAAPVASGGGATPASGEVARAAPNAGFPTPPPAPDGAVSEVRTLAGISPVQVIATLAGRKGDAAASERDCGSGPQAGVQCADLVVARIPKSVSSMPRVQVYAKKRGDSLFLGPCQELGDAIDCGQALGGTPGASLRLVGRKPRLEVIEGSFSIRWRAINLAAEDHDVKLVVSY